MFRPNGTDLKVRQELSWLTGEILRNGKHVEQAEWLGSEGTILYSGGIFIFFCPIQEIFLNIQ